MSTSTNSLSQFFAKGLHHLHKKESFKMTKIYKYPQSDTTVSRVRHITLYLLSTYTTHAISVLPRNDFVETLKHSKIWSISPFNAVQADGLYFVPGRWVCVCIPVSSWSKNQTCSASLCRNCRTRVWLPHDLLVHTWYSQRHWPGFADEIVWSSRSSCPVYQNL